MLNRYNIDEIDKQIRQIGIAAAGIEQLAGDIEAIKKNLVRLKASVKMLELNISDVKLVLNT